MEDLLRFIPFVLYGLYLLFGKSKKNKQTPQSTSQPSKSSTSSSSTPTLQDILRELSGQEAPAPVAESKPKAQKQLTLAQEREKIEIIDHQYDFRPEYEHHSSKHTVTKEPLKGITLLRVEEEEEKEIEPFDLYQAVVAQTILNRPEY
jgi:hypothetical protein